MVTQEIESSGSLGTEPPHPSI